jgi:hypothetical protein
MMPMVACPDCMQEGRVPDSFLGRRIKCSKCGGRFLVSGLASGPSIPAAGTLQAGAVDSGSSTFSTSTPAFEGIVVEGFEGGWSEMQVQDVAPVEVPAEPPRHAHSPIFGASLGATGLMRPEGVKEYKLLTPKDKVFDNKFDLARLEEVINAYALNGWMVRSMTTAQVAAFSGGMREELLVLLER